MRANEIFSFKRDKERFEYLVSTMPKCLIRHVSMPTKEVVYAVGNIVIYYCELDNYKEAFELTTKLRSKYGNQGSNKANRNS